MGKRKSRGVETHEGGDAKETIRLENGFDNDGEAASDPSGDEEDFHEDADFREGQGNGVEEDENAGLPSAFSRAFGKIMKKRVPESEFTEVLGPVLAERKQLLTKQIEEEEVARKTKISLKERKREVSGKGHVLPQTYTDPKEKALIKLATKGVVRLFNAVTKAQKVQAETDSSSRTAAKAVWKQSKAAFMTELGASTKTETGSHGAIPGIMKEDDGHEGNEGWAVLQSGFMLGTSNKLKDWDKNLQDPLPANKVGTSV